MFKDRPIIILKYAMGLNGSIGSDKERIKFSNDLDKEEVNLLRSQVDGILVGAGTALSDNPKLYAIKNNGELYTNQPARIILKGERELPSNLNIFDQSISKTILINSKENGDYLPLDNILKKIKDLGINSLLVEGGSKIISTFLDSGFIDQVRILFSPKFNFEGSVFTQLSKDIDLSSDDLKIERLDNQYVLSFKSIHTGLRI